VSAARPLPALAAEAARFQCPKCGSHMRPGWEQPVSSACLHYAHVWRYLQAIRELSAPPQERVE
jgi:hypothetical protein